MQVETGTDAARACTCVLVAALLTRARRQKPCRRPAEGEQVHKVWFVHRMEYALALRREILTCAMMGMSPEALGLMNKPVTETNTGGHEVLRAGKFREMESRTGSSRGVV